MNISYNVSAKLDSDQIFALVKESIEEKTGKMLCTICWEQDDAGQIKCELVFRDETVELE